ncbi:MAG: NHLP bacteriocin export ABC transporter permease/ATPase subunit [Chloroflexota bacterium]
MANREVVEGEGEKPKVEELFLLELRYKEGRLVEVGSNKPILLNDRESAWVVYAGKVNVFAVRTQAGEAIGPRAFLYSAEVGQAVFGLGLGQNDQGLGLLAVGVTGTRLLKLKRARLMELAQDQEYAGLVAALVEHWVVGLTQGIARAIPPKECELLEAGVELALAESGLARPKKGVLWVKHLAGASQWFGRPDLTLMGQDGYLPVSSRGWLKAAGANKVLAVDTWTFMAQDASWSALDTFHQLVLQSITANAEQEEQTERERLQNKALAHRLNLENAVSQLASVLQAEEAGGMWPVAGGKGVDGEALLAACRLVGGAMGLTIVPHPDAKKGKPPRDPLGAIAKASRIRMRQVALRGEWWRQDNGPLLAYVEEGRRPVTLLPKSPRRYLLHDPAAGTVTPVTDEVAATLAPFAYAFYRPFPHRPLTAWDLLKMGLVGRKSDLAMVLLMAAAVGLLALITPIATGLVFDSVIPGAARSQLVQISLALVVSALAMALFQISQSFAMLRLEGGLDAALQAAVWDRLLSLPVPFFRNYTAGDLGLRAMGISHIRRTLSGTTISSILAGLFSIFSFALLFYYNKNLAYLATGLVFVAVLVTTASGYLQVRHQRGLVGIQGRLSGLVLQFITGMAKFRVAGAESRAFAAWASEFSAQKKIAYKARSVANGLMVFNVAYPVLATLAIFAMMAFAKGVSLSTGNFLAFNAAFGQFLLAGLQLSAAFTSALSVVPVYERLKPILQTLPEVDETKADPGELTGEIEVSHISFRYQEGGPLILKDVSLSVHPGEFIALVGPSGSGKSTLFRLLVGFETPASGAIYYDGQDLAGLDIQAVRRQVGVVLQNGKLMAGSIFTNIIGSSLLTIDDAWEAAGLVALDEDLKVMPMGMHTVISEGGGTLSGGQRQRLLIARAIVTRPRILFFDEATSALDNNTQAVVSQSLENLQATRIVIAHRLSTIMNADRIYVLKNGEMAQSGTYQELINQPGVFADLARRQIA